MYGASKIVPRPLHDGGVGGGTGSEVGLFKTLLRNCAAKKE
jgi:hypothetical protein